MEQLILVNTVCNWRDINLKTFEVEMKFNVGDSDLSMDEIDDKLYEAGYGDAFVCHNGVGSVSITFSRKEISKFQLVRVTRIEIKQLFPKVEWLADSK